MKDFVLTKDKNFTFGECKNCQANCCNGLYGSTFSQIILEEFKNVYENFPILFIFGDLGFIKPVILLSNGKSFCPYLKNFACTIYEKRPKVCRTYPLSPNLDNQIYIDKSCPEVNKSDNYLIKDNKIAKNFDNSVLYNYQDKYIKTHFEFESLQKKDFKKLIQIKQNNFYIYNGEITSKYLQFHKKSLNNLELIFQKEKQDLSLSFTHEF